VGIKIFIGYSSSDEERIKFIRNEIKRAFRNAKIFSFTEERISSPEGLQKNADNSLREADFAVFIISKPSGQNLKREMETAANLLKKREIEGVYIFYSAQLSEREINEIYDLFTEDLPDGSKNPYVIPKQYTSDYGVAREIIRDIELALRERDFKDVEFDFFEVRREIIKKWGSISYRYVGRKKYENELKKLLMKDNGQAVVTGFRGMGGIGKTVLTLKVVNDLLQGGRIGGVIWFEVLKESSAEEMIIRTLLSIVKKIDGKKASLKLIKNHWEDIFFRLKKKNVLIVIDSAEQNEKTSRELLDTFGGYGIKTLVTSRKLIKPTLPLIQVDVMEEEEAINLFKRIHFESINDTQLSSVKKICKRLGYLPLAVELVAVKSRTIGIKKTLELLKEEGIGFLRDDHFDDERYQNFVDKVIRLHYDELAEDEKKLFLTIALFSSLKIDEILNIYRELWETPFYSRNEVLRGIRALFITSLVKRYGEEYSLHPLVREFALRMLEEKMGSSSSTIRSKILLSLLEIYSGKDWAFIERNLKDIEELVEYRYEKGDEKYLRHVVDLIRSFLFSKGYWKLLLKYYSRLIHDPNFQFEYAWLLDVKGEGEKSIRFFREILQKEKEHSHLWWWALYMLLKYTREEKSEEKLLYLTSLTRYLFKEKEWNYLRLLLGRLGAFYEWAGYPEVARNYYISALKIEFLIKGNLRNILVSYADLCELLKLTEPQNSFELAKRIKEFIENRKENEIHGFKERKLSSICDYVESGILSGNLNFEEAERLIREVETIEKELSLKPQSLYLKTLNHLFNGNFENAFGEREKINNDFLESLVKALEGKDFNYEHHRSRLRYANKLFLEGVKEIEIAKRGISDSILLKEHIRKGILKVIKAKNLKECFGISPVFENWYLGILRKGGIEVRSEDNEVKNKEMRIDIISSLRDNYLYIEPDWVSLTESSFPYTDEELLCEAHRVLNDYFEKKFYIEKLDRIYLYPLIFVKEDGSVPDGIQPSHFEATETELRRLVDFLFDIPDVENICRKFFGLSRNELRRKNWKDIKTNISLNEEDFKLLVGFSFTFKTFKEKKTFYKKAFSKREKFKKVLLKDVFISIKNNYFDEEEVKKFLLPAEQTIEIDRFEFEIDKKQNIKSTKSPQILEAPSSLWKKLVED